MRPGANTTNDIMAARQFYRWIRDLHLYVGLFASPFVVVYAISVIWLNHAFLPWGGSSSPKRALPTIPVVVHDTDNGLAVASQVRAQVGVRGEIGYVNRKPGGVTLTFPIEIPGRRTNVRVDLAKGTATVEEQATGIWDATVYLHKTPGPHNAKLRGNWIYMRLWSWLADATVYFLLFLSVSGVYMWALIRAERRIGLVCLGGGVLSFVAIFIAIVR